VSRSRKRRKTRKIHPIWIIAALIAASAVYVHRTELGALKVTLIIIASGVVLGAVIGYRRGRRRAVVVTAPPRKKAVAKSRKPATDPALPATKQARRNGWIPPEKSSGGALTITPECAGDECAVCPDPANCACSCEHDAAKIVARNTAHYDQTHNNDEIPY
jgi:hypothetical protein